MKKQKCEKKECFDRHPTECKQERSIEGCKRNVECDYLHVTNVNVEVKETHDEGCEYYLKVATAAGMTKGIQWSVLLGT